MFDVDADLAAQMVGLANLLDAARRGSMTGRSVQLNLTEHYIGVGRRGLLAGAALIRSAPILDVTEIRPTSQTASLFQNRWRPEVWIHGHDAGMADTIKMLEPAFESLIKRKNEPWRQQ